VITAAFDPEDLKRDPFITELSYPRLDRLPSFECFDVTSQSPGKSNRRRAGERLSRHVPDRLEDWIKLNLPWEFALESPC
jgi:hypothetical protein